MPLTLDAERGCRGAGRHLYKIPNYWLPVRKDHSSCVFQAVSEQVASSSTTEDRLLTLQQFPSCLCFYHFKLLFSCYFFLFCTWMFISVTRDAGDYSVKCLSQHQKHQSLSNYSINTVEHWSTVTPQCYAASLHCRHLSLPTPAGGKVKLEGDKEKWWLEGKISSV